MELWRIESNEFLRSSIACFDIKGKSRARSISGRLHLPGPKRGKQARASMRGTDRDLCSGARLYGPGVYHCCHHNGTKCNTRTLSGALSHNVS